MTCLSVLFTCCGPWRTELQGVLVNYKEQLGNDPIIAAHLGSLQDSLMEQNLLRVIEPFSQVEIAHVAKLIELPLAAGRRTAAH